MLHVSTGGVLSYQYGYHSLWAHSPLLLLLLLFLLLFLFSCSISSSLFSSITPIHPPSTFFQLLHVTPLLFCPITPPHSCFILCFRHTNALTEHVVLTTFWVSLVCQLGHCYWLLNMFQSPTDAESSSWLPSCVFVSWSFPSTSSSTTRGLKIIPRDNTQAIQNCTIILVWAWKTAQNFSSRGSCGLWKGVLQWTWGPGWTKTRKTFTVSAPQLTKIQVITKKLPSNGQNCFMIFTIFCKIFVLCLYQEWFFSAPRFGCPSAVNVF